MPLLCTEKRCRGRNLMGGANEYITNFDFGRVEEYASGPLSVWQNSVEELKPMRGFLSCVSGSEDLCKQKP